MKHNPYKVVRMFEEEVAEYTGAPDAVAVDSGTNALFLCCRYLEVGEVTIPRHTYISVPQSILHAGGRVRFEALAWEGMYQLKPYPIWDAAKRFTSAMYVPGTLVCLSFHIKKHLKIGKGGMILTDDPRAVDWLKRARYEGRIEEAYRVDNTAMVGWNMYMTPVDAARGLMLMQDMPAHNPDLAEQYPDLAGHQAFRSTSQV
jgi:dTDP-4-amino-4,6-dideoxygalactose transaminase